MRSCTLVSIGSAFRRPRVDDRGEKFAWWAHLFRYVFLAVFLVLERGKPAHDQPGGEQHRRPHHQRWREWRQSEQYVSHVSPMHTLPGPRLFYNAGVYMLLLWRNVNSAATPFPKKGDDYPSIRHASECVHCSRFPQILLHSHIVRGEGPDHVCAFSRRCRFQLPQQRGGASGLSVSALKPNILWAFYGLSIRLSLFLSPDDSEA